MRGILFDFGGTLDFPRHWLDRFLAHYQAAGIDIERPALDHAFTIATRKAYASSAKLRNYSLSELVALLVELQFENLSYDTAFRGRLAEASLERGVDEIAVRIRDSFVAESAVGFATTRRLLASLAASGSRKIAVVSNFYGNLDRVIADAGFATAITVTADSGLLGFYKPDHRIFGAALAKLGVQPQQAIMVGDSILNDCAPARAMGMKTVWLRHREFSGRAPSSELVDFTIDNLEALKDFGCLTG